MIRNTGELKTRITILRRAVNKDADGYGVETLYNIYPDCRYAQCKWVNAYGTEAIQANALGVEEPATLTLRYTPLVDAKCLVQRIGDPSPYEILSINDVNNQHVWLEIKIRRRVAAR